nr:uncharacterized protein LOC123495830 [Aegilops tauschii subsp. strangulata]
MWLYSGIDNTTRIHPEEVDEETVAQWLQGITGNKDNPRGSRRVPQLDNTYEPDKVYTEMYSMPNGEQVQEQEQEGEVIGGEIGDWQSDGGDDEESEDSSDGEEVESPPRSERCSKQRQDPSSVRGKATAPTGQTSKRTRTSSPVPTEKAPKQPKVAPSKPRKALPKIKVAVPIASSAATSGTSVYKDDDDEEMEDAVTSNAAPPNVIELPDDDEDVPLRPMGRGSRTSGRKASTNKTPQSTPTTEPVIQQSGDLNRASVTFAIPLSKDQVSAANEAIHQAGIMMEQMKVVREANQAAYDASSALQANVQRSCELGARKMNQALAKKDLDLAAAQKTAEEKTALADQKLASVGKLEEENTKLKAALDEANRENFEEEIGRIETSLDPILSPVKDEAAMNVLQRESHLASVMDYLAQLKVAMSRIDTTLWPRATFQNDLESLMTRLNEILVECRNGRSLRLGVVLTWLCLWFASTARKPKKRS